MSVDDRALYTTGDIDIDPLAHELVIFPGDNGDWYVQIAPQGERVSRGVRITTSGTRVDGLAVAIADAYRAIKASNRSTIQRRHVTPPRGCNRHDDCSRAIDAYRARHGAGVSLANFCCTDECCEDCFGS